MVPPDVVRFASWKRATPPEYHANLGRGADGLCIKFLQVPYKQCNSVRWPEAADEEILEWCYDYGRRLEEDDLTVWNGFILKLGWRDMAAKRLEKVKADSGLAHRNDIQTIPLISLTWTRDAKK